MFVQQTLSYGFAELEPYIDELTMLTHYNKHHAGYTNNLNTAVEKEPSLQDKTIEEILTHLDSIKDEQVRTTVRNNGGGFYNHNLYFSSLSPKPAKAPTGILEKQIVKDFGTIDDLKTRLTGAATGRFGSGWAWLSLKKDGSLSVSSTPNQDNPLMTGTGDVPILGIDVWEHAYYLKYKNLRGDYVKAFWNVVDWNAVATLFEAAHS
ncbi:superoxide dismutase [uncultured Sphaerochaeta sp.]|uniref:superoxide dismutase n=1 Tax=uncultured Sphaerochaeta sp. TaxID=886478 RepID=UPI002A0A81D4|nr:superoxide dismutase [uncultured Sphaerochaeta sp.]